MIADVTCFRYLSWGCKFFAAVSTVNKLIGAIALFLLTLMAAIAFSAQHPAPIAALVVFGDSLSDVGNVFRATGGVSPPNPPYFQGRYSNGRVWVEYLADSLEVDPDWVQNLAYGGATTGRSGNTPVPGLLSQVQTYVQAHPGLESRGLYVLWAGANDYLQGADRATVPVNHVQQAIAALANAGAERLLVANLPDLGTLPSTLNRPEASRLSTVSQNHNLGLRRSLKLLKQEYSHLQIALLDVYTLYQEAITRPSQFGFTNVIHPCLSGVQPCRTPEQFLFWDGIHPTTAAHRILANRAVAILQEEGIVPPVVAALEREAG